jgi:23S rRNA (uracil1939-C5)-methyltransferase
MAVEIDFTPTRWAPTGEAEGFYRGQLVKVFGGIPGERARVKVQHRGTHQDVGTWREAMQDSPHRVEPRCGRYHLCGGCPIMHLDAPGQERMRRALVRQSLDDAGLSDVELGRFTPSPDGLDDYRHVIKLGVGYSDEGALRVGAWGRRSRTVVPIPECTVAAPSLRFLMGTIAYHVRGLDIRPYDPETDRGTLRAIVLRASRSSGEILVTLVAGRRIPQLEQLAEAVTEAMREVVGVVLHLNDEPGNAIYSRDEAGNVPTSLLRGRSYIEETLGGITYRIGAGDFFQTNPGLAERLWSDTIDALELQPEEPVVDLYCGVGGLALAAAKRTGWALGIEEVGGAIDAAREAARKNDLRAEFIPGKVDEVLDAQQARLGTLRPVLIVNPARRGLEPGVGERIVALRPRRIAYISCNPRAMGRDLAAFRAAGYEIGTVELYDMFPNTPHVESLVILRDPEASGLVRRAPRRGRATGGTP